MKLTRRTFLGSTAAGTLTTAFPRTLKAADHGIVRIGAKNDFEVLDPAYSRNVAETDIMNSIFIKLISYNGETWDTELDGAEAIEQVDPTHVKFVLRSGLGWTNGFGAVTAEDVKYSFERVANPANQSSWADDWALLDRVEVKSDREGVIVLKKPFAPLWRTTLPWSAGLIVCKAAVEQVGGRFTSEPPAECGPYVLKQWRPKQKTILARNESWSGPAPYFDEVHILPIDDRIVAESAFLAGDLDFVNVAPSSLPLFRDNPPPNTVIDPRTMVGMQWIGMNTGHPVFEDVRVRRAIHRAVDVDAVLEAGYFGAAQRANGVIAPGLPGGRPKNPYPERDVGAARQLLKEAGRGGGFSTTLSIINATDLKSMAQVIQSNLAEIGVDVEILAVESGTFWNLGSESAGDAWKDLQMYIHRWGNGPDPSWATKFYICDGVGIFNWERWCSADYTRLNAEAMAEIDEDRRAGLYSKMSDLLDESAAYLLLTHGVQLLLYRDDLVPGVNPDGFRLSLSKFRRA